MSIAIIGTLLIVNSITTPPSARLVNLVLKAHLMVDLIRSTTIVWNILNNMEERTIIVGDHTGTIKVLTPQLSSLCSASSAVLNIIPRNDKFLAVRVNGTIDEFDLTGNLLTLREGKQKIIDGAVSNDRELVTYPDGTFEIEDNKTKSGISECKGISVYNELIALCGRSTSEIWDINTAQLKWKAWTRVPREEVFDTKCIFEKNLLYVATSKNEIKIHDTRTGKKPSAYIRLNPEGHIYDFPISSLYLREDSILAGDSIGHIYKMSKSFKILGKTKGRSVGAIQSIHSKEDEIYSCGLDRRIMVHDVNSMKLIHKQYLWQKLTKILVV